MNDICCVGHITLDKIVVPGRNPAYSNGGTAYYFMHALRQLGGVSLSLVTSLAERDMAVVDELVRYGVDVIVQPGTDTVYFENSYGENMNNRKQRVLAKAAPFTIESIEGIDARYVHVGSLLADDFTSEILTKLSEMAILSVDAQGFLRRVQGEAVMACDWADKMSIFPMIDILKVNEYEIEALTGSRNPHIAARRIASWGVREVLVTLGSYGSVIYSDGRCVEIPAYNPGVIVDATGCGDTYSAGYIYMRSKGASCEESGRFAAAMSSMKLTHTGYFEGDVAAVERFMKEAKIV